MEEDNFIEELDKRRQMFYFGGIGALVLAFLVLYIAIFYHPQQKSGTEQPADVSSAIEPAGTAQTYDVVPVTKEGCLALKDKEKSQECLDGITLDDAIDKDFFSECGEIVDEDTKNDCMRQVAHNLKDIDLCLKIPDAEKKERCVSDVAVSLRDPSVCSAVYSDSFELKECQDVASSFAIAYSGRKDDIKECAKLETKEYSNLCFVNSYDSKYGGDCSKVPSAYRQYCIDGKAATGARTAADCDVVADPDRKDLCLKVAELGLTEASQIDTDKDGVADGNELFMNTDPKNPDTDGDGLNDGYEWVISGTDPGKEDSDGDGLNDYEEIRVYKTDPKNPDTDGDGRPDGLEIKMGKNPLEKD